MQSTNQQKIVIAKGDGTLNENIMTGANAYVQITAQNPQQRFSPKRLMD